MAVAKALAEAEEAGEEDDDEDDDDSASLSDCGYSRFIYTSMLPCFVWAVGIGRFRHSLFLCVFV